MAAAFYLLLVIGTVGAFDVVYFHTYRCRLHERPECQREVLWHTARHLIYALQFIFIANLRLHGAAIALLALLYLADVAVAWSDVWEETGSRKVLGGLPRGEYFMHVVLSVLVGIYIATVAHAVWPDRLRPISIAYAPPPVPVLLRMAMNTMAVVALVAFAYDLRRWISFRRRLRA